MNLLQLSLNDIRLSDFIKNPPSKKALNIVIGFDCVYKQVRILRLFGLDFGNAVLQTYSFTAQFLSEEFFKQFKEIFDDYFKTLPTAGTLASYVVLPDNAVAMDNISIPVMQSNKLRNALTNSLQNEYKSYKELQFSYYLIGSNKQYVSFNVTVLRKNYLTNIYRCMAVNKLYTKNATFAANCMVNTVLNFKPSYRKKSFILMDIKADYTKVAICAKGRTAGFADVMLGLAHLKDDKVLQENMQYNHDVADLAIINAKEKARMKALTVDELPEDLEEVAENVMNQLVEGVNKNETIVANEKIDDSASQVIAEINDSAQNVNTLQSAVDEIVNNPEEPEEMDEFEIEQAEEERKARLLIQMAESRKKKVFARKMPKRLPKFMLRPVPENKEGIVYENFRMFIKSALLYIKQLKKWEFFPKIDCVVVNLPDEYAYLCDMANSEEEKSEVPFEFLGNLGSSNINGNLDLVGALYSGIYNKRQNF